MKIMKFELARAVDKVRSIVAKNNLFPALAGVLVKDGYLIASNSELTIQVTLEGSEGEEFIIPMRGLDLIKNLPEGEVELTADADNTVTIKMDKLKNKYQSLPPEEFSFYKGEPEAANGVRLSGSKIINALSHVIFAVASDKVSKREMTGVCLDGQRDYLNVVALNGYMVALDRIKVPGADGIKLIVPQGAVKKIISMGVSDDITLTYDKNCAIFKSDTYTIFTRLIEGKYYKYDKMFSMGTAYTVVGKKDLLDAVGRARTCTDEMKPVVFDFETENLTISVNSSISDYQETIHLQSPMEIPAKISFDSKLVIESLKSFSCDNITLNLGGPKMPMVIEAEDSDMKALVLPVQSEN